jgi:Uma2 family endonuclease
MHQTELLLTYDDYLSLPNDGKRYEIIGGELFMSPAPEPEHQDVLRNIFTALASFVSANALGKVYCAPIDVVLSMTDIVQPDIVFIARNRLSIVRKKNIIAAPDLVMEIVSPSTAIVDRTRKKTLYEHYGVREYWIVDSETTSVELYVRGESRFGDVTIFRAPESAASSVLSGFTLPVQQIFQV